MYINQLMFIIQIVSHYIQRGEYTSNKLGNFESVSM